MTEQSQSALSSLRNRLQARSADFLKVSAAENDARDGLPPLPRRPARPDGVVFEPPLSAGDVWRPSQELQVVHSREDDPDGSVAEELDARDGAETAVKAGAASRMPARAFQPEPQTDDDAQEAVSPLASMMRLPSLRQAQHSWLFISFLVVVALPMIAATLYYAILAKPQYTAEFKFSVTEQTPALPGVSTPPSNSLSASASSSAAMATMAAGMGTGMLSNGTVQNYIVVDFVKSREEIGRAHV